MFRYFPGQTLGRYHIVEEIGAGGMGVVYRAHDDRLSRDVALKFLPAGALADETARRRCRQEALALAKLNHPNIATIFDFDTQGDNDFLVIEYIPGETLDRRLVNGALDEKEVVRLGDQLASGLSAAHERGVLHRDLKPANIRVTPDGLLKILDFGLARLLDPAEGVSTADTIVLPLGHQTGFAGTPPYMAPEQVRRDPIDVRTDIYGAGVVLYELACGRRPFVQAAPSDLMQAVMHALPTPPRSLVQVSSALEAIILKALAKDPAQRHQNARELRDELRGLSAAVPSRSRRVRAVDSIAVLPFENTTGEAQMDYLTEGITEALIHSLSALPSFKKVIARNSVYRYRGRDVSPEQAGRELDVRSVLVGQVRQRDDLLMISAELVDVATSQHLWGAQYDRKIGDLSRLEHAIADEVARSLGHTLRPTKQSSVRGSSASNAYHLYLKGRYYWNKRPAAGMVQKAIELFQQATEAEPQFARAYAGLADCYNTLGAWEASGLPPQVAFPQATMTASRALRLDPQLAEAHAAQAYTALHFEWNWTDAQQGFRRSLQLNPKYVHCRHWHAHYLVAAGRFDQALAESLQIIELDPLDLIINVHLAWHHQMAHDFEKALETSERTLDLEPHFHWGHFFAGWAHEQLGDFDRAVDSLRRSAELSGGSIVMRTALAHAYASAGDVAAARREMNTFSGVTGTAYVSPYELGLIHIALHEVDEGWQLLDRACEERSGWMPYVRAEPRLAHLHGDPRFAALLSRVGLPPLEPPAA